MSKVCFPAVNSALGAKMATCRCRRETVKHLKSNFYFLSKKQFQRQQTRTASHVQHRHVKSSDGHINSRLMLD